MTRTARMGTGRRRAYCPLERHVGAAGGASLATAIAGCHSPCDRGLAWERRQVVDVSRANQQEVELLIPLLSTLALAAPQGVTPQPTSRPTAQPLTDRQRMVEAEWKDDAPGTQVVRMGGKNYKWLPMVGATYGTPEKVAKRVSDRDLVIGLEISDRAFAFPISMLGGPQREIVNDEYGGVPVAVNW